MSRILLAGEQYTSTKLEVKGSDIYTISTNNIDGVRLTAVLREGGHDVTRILTSHVPMDFPESVEAMRRFDVVILSDVGADSLLFHPDVLAKSARRPNRLRILEEYVSQGGGLAMIGGWMSFAGIGGRARYHGTAVEEALPVSCQSYDDRRETPEGVVPEVLNANHPILQGVEPSWPFFLGYNRLTPKPHASVLLAVGNDPFLCVGDHGKGRSAAFASDCDPHWGPPDFLNWPSYGPFWNNLVGWLSSTS